MFSTRLLSLALILALAFIGGGYLYHIETTHHRVPAPSGFTDYTSCLDLYKSHPESFKDWPQVTLRPQTYGYEAKVNFEENGNRRRVSSDELGLYLIVNDHTCRYDARFKRALDRQEIKGPTYSRRKSYYD